MENWTEFLYHAMATAAIVGAAFRFMWGRLDKKFDKIDERFDKIDERFDRVEERIGRLENRVGIIETRLDERLPKKEPTTIDITDSQMEKVVEKTMRAIESRRIEESKK